jgi:hypothetical protein
LELENIKLKIIVENRILSAVALFKLKKYNSFVLDVFKIKISIILLIKGSTDNGLFNR